MITNRGAGTPNTPRHINTASHAIHGALGDLTAIPVHTDATVPPGTAILDVDPDEPRHITRVRANNHDFTLSSGQEAQIRDHYQAMNERAGQVLAWWNKFAERHLPQGWGS